MKERIISNKELKKLKHFNPCAHSESVLYIDKDKFVLRVYWKHIDLLLSVSNHEIC